MSSRWPRWAQPSSDRWAPKRSVSAPGDQEFVDLLARAAVALAPAFMPVREWIEAARKQPADIPTYGARMIGRQYEAITAAAEGRDAIIATGLMPSAAAAQSVRGRATRPSLRARQLLPAFPALASPSAPRLPRTSRPRDMSDPRALWTLNIRDMNALFGEGRSTRTGRRSACHPSTMCAPTSSRDHALARVR